MGHRLTGEGLKPSNKRVQAILKLRNPENQAELETVLDVLAYYGNFMPNLSELSGPLREFKQAEQWKWTDEASTAFVKIKEALVSTDVLKYYDVKKSVIFAVNASSKGLCAAVIQEDGVVAFATRTLTAAEQRYAQIVLLAVDFGCTQFHKLIYGKCEVVIQTDNKPLKTIIQKSVCKAAMRLQKMVLKLQPHQFKLKHVRGKYFGLADCLSRFQVENLENELPIDGDLMLLTGECHTSVMYDKIYNKTNGMLSHF